MKRTIKHPDGRVEEQEGTAEELAAFDRANAPAKSDYEKGKGPWPVAPLPDLMPPGQWTLPAMPSSQACLFEGLPPGAYMLSCPCPRHSVYRHA